MCLQSEKIPKKKKKRSYNVPTQWQAENDPTYAAWLPPKGLYTCPTCGAQVISGEFFCYSPVDSSRISLLIGNTCAVL